MELEVGSLFLRKYLIERLVGQGCMGRLYEARDNVHERQVAIRLIEPEYDNERVMGFNEHDANAVGRIRNVHLAELVSVGILPSGERCIITEFVEGETLQRRMGRLGRMSQLGVTQLLSQLMVGLGAALQAGVAHRDLTPRSIFIAPVRPGPGHIARIVDFGISRLAVLRSQPNGALATNDSDRNSFQYLSPEQLNGLREPDARSNIYTLGVIAYEAMTGRLPFECKDFATLASSILLEEPRPIEQLVPEASPQLVQLIRQAMARSPNSRYQSVEEMAAVVAAITDQSTGLYMGLESKPPPGGSPEPASVSVQAPLAAQAESVPMSEVAPEYPPPPPPPPPIDGDDDDDDDEQGASPAIAAASAPDYPPPPPPPPPTDGEEWDEKESDEKESDEKDSDETVQAPVVAAAPAPTSSPSNPAVAVPAVASTSKYPAPPMDMLAAAGATAPKYPAPMPLATTPRYPSPQPAELTQNDATDGSQATTGGRPAQATSPGLQPEPAPAPIAAKPASEPVAPATEQPVVSEPAAPATEQPIVVAPVTAAPAPAPTPAEGDEPAPGAAAVEPAAQTSVAEQPASSKSAREYRPIGPPPTAADKDATRAAATTGTVAQAQPAISAEPVSNVRQRLEPLPAERPDEVGTDGQPQSRSRKPLLLVALLIGLVGAGIAFVLIPGASPKRQVAGPSVEPSAPAQGTSARSVARTPASPVDSIAVHPVDAETPTVRQAPAVVTAPVSPPTQAKTQPSGRSTQSAKKSTAATSSTPSTPAKKTSSTKRDSAKDPYNYR